VDNKEMLGKGVVLFIVFFAEGMEACLRAGADRFYLYTSRRVALVAKRY
jgi:hypothetical protein